MFINWQGSNPEEIGTKLNDLCEGKSIKLKMITNRGVKVFPDGRPETYCTDHWRCRFIAKSTKVVDGKQMDHEVTYEQIIDLLTAVNDAKINAKLNKINNVTFVKEDSTKFLMNLALNKNKVDVLFLDPPRSGSTYNFIKAVANLNIKNRTKTHKTTTLPCVLHSLSYLLIL